jgi:hypothetical protein
MPELASVFSREKSDLAPPIAPVVIMTVPVLLRRRSKSASVGEPVILGVVVGDSACITHKHIFNDRPPAAPDSPGDKQSL